MPDKYLSINEAASYLKVSEKTLRRWEKRGLLSPARTSGGHRRYLLSTITSIKQKGARNIAKYQASKLSHSAQSPILDNYLGIESTFEQSKLYPNSLDLSNLPIPPQSSV